MSLVSTQQLIEGAIAGNVVSFPTDTVPALAVKPENSALIFTLKQREAKKPLILMAASFAELLPFVEGSSQEMAIWREMAQTYLPGPLTMVLPVAETILPPINPGHTLLGVRVPNCAIAQDILAQTGPLVTTSANLSGKPPLETREAINQTFPTVLTLNLATWTEPLGSGLPSTVAKWTGNDWEILRQGSINL